MKSILLYKCGTWGLSKSAKIRIDSFHRRQLRIVINVKWPNKIKNKRLYEITRQEQISKTILERRWTLLGHVMRLSANCPARKAMRYYFEDRSTPKFAGRKRMTIVKTLNEDISLARKKCVTFKVIPLVSHVSLQNLHNKAKNRKLWRNIVKQVVDSAYS